jgi:hypothetical protein
MYKTTTILLSSAALIFMGCGGGESTSTGTTVAGAEDVSPKSFEAIETPKSFKWDTSSVLSLNIVVKENIVTVNSDGRTLDSHVVLVDSAIVTLGYEDTNITTLKTDSEGKILLNTKLPSHIDSINLFATSNGFTQKREVSLENISNAQTILIERSPEPTKTELLEERE